MAEEIQVNKLGGYVQMSRETAMEYGIIPPDTEYLAQRAYWAERTRQSQEAAMALLVVALPALDSITEPLARDVLDLHQRDVLSGRWYCGGCDAEGYEVDVPSWPCRTTRLVAAHYGIELPKDATDIRRPEDGSMDV